MKNWIRNIKQEWFGRLLVGGFILSLVASLFTPAQWALNELNQQMLWGATFFFLCIGVAFGIITYIDKQTDSPQKESSDRANSLDSTPITGFYETQGRKDGRIVSILAAIQAHILVISPRIHEFGVEEQHHVERLVNKHLRELLKHYEASSTDGQKELEDDLVTALMYIEGTLRDVYLNQLNEHSLVQFKKTSQLLVK